MFILHIYAYVMGGGGWSGLSLGGEGDEPMHFCDIGFARKHSSGLAASQRFLFFCSHCFLFAVFVRDSMQQKHWGTQWVLFVACEFGNII